MTHLPEPLESRIAPATLDLSQIAADDGRVLVGSEAGANFGAALGPAGDVNGDGLADLILAAPRAGANGSDSGSVWVVFGRTDGMIPALNALDGTNGFEMRGEAGDDFAGIAVAAAGDVNGDGFDDVLIGASGLNRVGGAYVIFGKEGAFAAVVELSTLGAGGFRMTAGDDDFGAGTTVAAGDINGDGLADVVVGSPRNRLGGNASGAAYVVFGKATAFAAEIALDSLTGTDGFIISGAAEDEEAATALCTVDVDGDGFDDVVLGAPNADRPGKDEYDDAGAIYIVRGKSSAFPANFQLSTIDGNNGGKLRGAGSQHYLGTAVARAGDIDGDGFDDLLVGATGANQTRKVTTYTDEYGYTYSEVEIYSAGAVYLLPGDLPSVPHNTTADSVAANRGFELKGHTIEAELGESIGAIGDINRDGFDDLAVAAFDKGFVVYGGENVRGLIALKSLPESRGFAFEGFTFDSEVTGGAVAVPRPALSGVDVNGDKVSDFLIGDSAGGDGTPPPGVVSVVYGSRLTMPGNDQTASFFDADGDQITIKVNKGQLDEDFIQLVPAGTLGGALLEQLDLSDARFKGANVTITAKRTPLGGDGAVNVGFINAGTNDLGGVTIAGDLARIVAGDANLKSPAVKKLAVTSFGEFAAQSQPGETAPLQSIFTGPAGPIVVAGDATGVALHASGGFGSVKIGGDFTHSRLTADDGSVMALRSLAIGGDVRDSSILLGYDATGAPSTPDVRSGPVKIKGGWQDSQLRVGVSGTNADQLINGGGAGEVIARLASIAVGGQAFGSTAAGDAFFIAAEQIGSAKIGAAALRLTPGADDISLGVTGDLRVRDLSGAAAPPPLVPPGGTLAIAENKRSATYRDVDGDTVTVAVTRGELSEALFDLEAGGTVGGFQLRSLDLTAASFAGGGLSITAKPTAGGNGLANIGLLNAEDRDLGAVKIAGDLGRVIAGDGDPAKPGITALTVQSIGWFGTETQVSVIDGRFGALTVRGDVRGATISATTFGAVSINGDLENTQLRAAGNADPLNKAAATALARLTVQGDLRHSAVLLGYDQTGNPVESDVLAGPIKIRGYFVASSLVVGIRPNDGTGVDTIFGNGNDAVIPGGTPGFLSRLASLTVGLQIRGTAAAGDHFGIVAESLGALRMGKTKFPLTPGPDNFLLGVEADTRAREVAP